MALVLAALAAVVTSGRDSDADAGVVAAPTIKVTPDQPSSRRVREPGPGEAFVARMRALDLQGSDWEQSDRYAPWKAQLRKAVGGIEVSCVIESSVPGAIERAEVELEIYSLDYTERAAKLTDVFRSAVALLAPDLPEGLLDAPVPWVFGNTRLERLPDTGSRNVLRFTLSDPAASR